MPSTDITLCQDQDCPLKDDCIRFLTKTDSIRQSYFTESPRNGNTCNYYWSEQEVQWKYKEK